jgi:hypothetical protein
MKSTVLIVLFLIAVAPLRGQIPADTSKPKLDLGGVLRAEVGFFESSRDPGRIPSRTFLISGNPNLRYGDWSIRTLLQVGNFQDRLLQPFNKFGISPSFKWVTLHLGHHQQKFSPFTYQNHLILGGGIELNPRKLRFTSLFGELRRGTDGGFLDDNRFSRPTLKRMASINKLGFGTSDNFVDIIFLKGWDEIEQASPFTDSLRIYPEENVVFGIHSEQLIAKVFRLILSGALSAYTLDRRSTEIDTDPFFADDLVLDIFQPRISSQFLGAGLISFEYRKKSWQAKAEYSVIQPGFQSMGMYFNQNDLSNFELSGRGNLFKRRLNLSAIYRRSANNVLNTRTSQNTRNFLNFNAFWMQGRLWTANIGISYFTTVQEPANGQSIDTFLFSQSTSQYSAGFNKRRKNGGNHFNVNLTWMNRVNRVNDESQFQNLSLRGIYAIPLFNGERWSLNPEINFAYFLILTSARRWRYSPVIGLFYRDTEEGFNGQLRLIPTFESIENGQNRFNWRSSLNVSYRFKTRNQVFMRLEQSTSSGGIAYNEVRGTLGYRLIL